MAHTFHHRKNRSQGGEWDPANIVHLCGDGTRGCHGWVGANPAAAAVEGFHVKPWEDPADIPIQSWRGTVHLGAVPVVPSVDEGTASTCFTPPNGSYAERVDMQDPWFTSHPD